MSWSCFGSIEEWVTEQRRIRAQARAADDIDVHARQRRAAAEFAAQVRDIRRRAIADRRARYVIALVEMGPLSFLDAQDDARWWHEGLTSLERARLMLAAGGTAW